MRYCPECGTKIEKANKNHETVNHKKISFLKAAGVLTSFAASLCFIIGIIGLLAFSSGAWYYYDYYPLHPDYEMYYPPYHYYVPMTQYVLTAAFGFFAFILGLISGLLVLMRKLFNLTMIGQVIIMVAGIMLLAVEFWFFLLLGIPILVIVAISMVFTSMSKNEFVS